MSTSTVANSNSVQYVIGNDYERIPQSEANLDRSQTYRKIHKWTLYVDVTAGDVNLIDRVEFNLGTSFVPQVFEASAPVRIRCANGTKAWRFKTEQSTYGPITASIRIRGAGGTHQELSHYIQLKDAANHSKYPLKTFTEWNRPRPLRPVRFPDTARFGIELELSTSEIHSTQKIANLLDNGVTPVQIMTYSQGRTTTSNTSWKIVPDSSIVCSRSVPNCNTFELVSPVLKGGDGLQKVNSILSKIKDNIHPKLKVNKSMGFHVHVDVSSYTLAQIKKICQNFIKYEDAIDTLMPLSRRSGSSESNSYFQSNRASVLSQIHLRNTVSSNRQCHDALESCTSIESLAQFMNQSGRYYKLNLQNLVNRRQTTIEFRQHSATTQYSKVSAWVRFCVAFCSNSAKLRTPTPFKKSRSVKEKFGALFQFVIKDRVLRDLYIERRETLLQEESCCNECDNSGGCCTHQG